MSTLEVKYGACGVTATGEFEIASWDENTCQESVNEFRDGVAAGRLAVVAGSGTGELAGLRGQGRWEAPSGTKGTFQLEYSFEPAG